MNLNNLLGSLNGLRELKEAIAAEEKQRTRPYEFYGENKHFVEDASKEKMLSGPAETGKTITALCQLNSLAWKYPGMQAVMVRKTYQSMHSTVLRTWNQKILPKNSEVTTYGGQKAQWFDYPPNGNGKTSRIYVSGMDNPDRVLSGEFDVIYVNQAEELTLADWEILLTRVTGRAGNMPYAQLMGDCNPGPSTHWILGRRDSGSLSFYESRHENNPILFDQDTGEITEQGKITIATLDSLTGPRKSRLRHGKWVRAEGIVYEGFDRVLHVKDPFIIPTTWRKIRSIDFGYKNAFVCQWWALDEDDRMYLYREIYMTRRTVGTHAPLINELSSDEWYDATVADHDAEDRATLAQHGIHTTSAFKAVSTGIQAVTDRLKVQEDGRPRIFIIAGALHEMDETLHEKRLPISTEQEFDSYIWAPSKPGDPAKEVPKKDYDHGMDAMRYAVAYVDNLKEPEQQQESDYQVVAQPIGFNQWW